MPVWPGRLAPIVSGWKRRTLLAEALRRALDNALAVLDVVTSRSAVSSDAKKGLGYVPDYQPLTAWDDAERRQRSLEVQ
jgi:acetolactate synthase-1/2/3 large subunit